MTINTVLFGFTFLNTSALLFLSIYIIITLSDLDCDYLNPTQCSCKLTTWIIPEIISFAINILVIAIANRWFLLMINVPVLAFMVYKLYVAIPYGCIGFYDPAEMHHQGTLKKHTRLAAFRVVFYLVHFFVYLYLFIISFLTGT